MRYKISGRQIDVGDALQTHVKSVLGETVEKYSQRPTDAAVVFSRNAYEYLCEATVHLSTGLTASAKGGATETMRPSKPAAKRWTSSFPTTSAA